jgi:hypothetical protein
VRVTVSHQGPLTEERRKKKEERRKKKEEVLLPWKSMSEASTPTSTAASFEFLPQSITTNSNSSSSSSSNLSLSTAAGASTDGFPASPLAPQGFAIVSTCSVLFSTYCLLFFT